MRSLEEMLTLGDGLDLTLEENLAMNTVAEQALVAEALVGVTSTPRSSDASCNPSAALDRLWYYLGQATGAHYRLLSWMAQNGYATTLPVRMLLRNYTLGSVVWQEWTDSLYMAIKWRDEWEAACEEANNAAFEPADER